MPITALNRLGIYPETRESILGKGLKFPFEFSSSTGSPLLSTATSAELEHVNDAIWQILGTKLGDRFMRPDFGSRLHELIFEPLDNIFQALVRIYTIQALDRWEKRIIVREVEFNEDATAYIEQGIFPGRIHYTLIRYQAEGNLVYPYARTEAGASLVRQFTETA
jgi:uncharacterized protein